MSKIKEGHLEYKVTTMENQEHRYLEDLTRVEKNCTFLAQINQRLSQELAHALHRQNISPFSNDYQKEIQDKVKENVSNIRVPFYNEEFPFLYPLIQAYETQSQFIFKLRQYIQENDQLKLKQNELTQTIQNLLKDNLSMSNNLSNKTQSVIQFFQDHNFQEKMESSDIKQLFKFVQEENKLLNQKSNKLASTLGQSIRENEALQKRVQELESQELNLQKTKQVLETENLLISSRLKKAETQLDDYYKLMDLKEEKYHEFDLQLLKKDDSIELLNKQISVLKEYYSKRINDDQNTIMQLKNESEQFQLTLTQNKQNIIALEEFNKKLKTQNEHLVIQVQDLSAQNLAIENTSQIDFDKIKLLKEQNENYKSQIQKLQFSEEEKQVELDLIQKKMKILQKQLSDTFNELNQIKWEKKSGAQQEYENRLEQFKNQLNKKDEINSSLLEQLQIANQKINIFQRDKQRLEQEKIDIESEIVQDLHDQITLLKNQLIENEQKADEKQNFWENEIKLLEDQIRQNEDNFQSQMECQQQINDVLQKDQTELRIQKENLQKELFELNKKQRQASVTNQVAKSDDQGQISEIDFQS